MNLVHCQNKLECRQHIIFFTVKNKMSLSCSEKEKFLGSFPVMFRLGL